MKTIQDTILDDISIGDEVTVQALHERAPNRTLSQIKNAVGQLVKAGKIKSLGLKGHEALYGFSSPRASEPAVARPLNRHSNAPSVWHCFISPCYYKIGLRGRPQVWTGEEYKRSTREASEIIRCANMQGRGHLIE